MRPKVSNGMMHTHSKGVNAVRKSDLSYEDLETKIELLDSKLEYQNQYIEQLQNIIADLRRHRFGTKSERFEHPAQGKLELDNSPLTQQTPEAFDETTIPAHKRRKRTKSHKELPRRIVIIPVEEKDKQCACGNEKTLIRYEVTEKLDYRPATFEIVEQRREVVACKNDCEQSIITASVPPIILPKVPVTESLLAHIIVSKFDDRQPLYHLEKQFASRYGIHVSRQSLSRWVVDTAKPLMPLLNELKDMIIDHDIA